MSLKWAKAKKGRLQGEDLLSERIEYDWKSTLIWPRKHLSRRWLSFPSFNSMALSWNGGR